MSAADARSGRSQAAKGFTLVELLVALVLLGLLSVMLFDGLRFGTRALTAGGHRVDRASEIAAAYGFLREALANLQPLPGDDTLPQPPIRFEGGSEHLEFIALPPGYLAPGGFQILELGLDPSASGGSPRGGERLALHWQGAARGPRLVEQAAIPPNTLLDHVGRIEFTYFGSTKPGDAFAWHQDWRSETVLPTLVRLHIEFADGWQPPDLVAAIRLADTSAATP